MRVSKTVREYIEEQVASKFPKTENELYYEQTQQIVSKASREYEERLAKAKQEIAEQVAQEYGIVEDMAKINLRWCNPYETCGTKVRMQAEIDGVERRKAINKKINDIIVTLELGGTKEDLERLLAEI